MNLRSESVPVDLIHPLVGGMPCALISMMCHRWIILSENPDDDGNELMVMICDAHGDSS